MAVDIYKPFTNPVTGESFRCISYDKDYSKWEWTVNPKGHSPFEHVHYNQDETITVKLGEAKIWVDRKAYILKPSESLFIHKGVPHYPTNNTDELLICEISSSPGLDHYIFMQCFIGLQMDSDYNEKGQINIAKLAYFMYKTKCNALARPASVPVPVFKFMMHFYGIIGTLTGWEKQLKRYIG
jgi:mannose-6-phosphate isomerase-like protein (cupin superfamily)